MIVLSMYSGIPSSYFPRSPVYSFSVSVSVDANLRISGFSMRISQKSEGLWPVLVFASGKLKGRRLV